MAAATLGVVASGVGMASLTLQLNDSVMKAIRFCESFNEAPENLKRVSEELHILTSIIQMVQAQDGSRDTDEDSQRLVEQCLGLAQKDIERLTKIIVELHQQIGSSHGKLQVSWAGLKVTNSTETIARLQNHVHSAVTVLNLLQVSRTQLAQNHMFIRIEEIAAGVKAVKGSVPDDLPISQRNISSCSKSIGIIEGHSNGGSHAPNPTRNLFEHHFKPTPFHAQTTTTWRTFRSFFGVLSFRSVLASVMDDEDNAKAAKGKIRNRNGVIDMLFGFQSCRRGYRFQFSDNFDHWVFHSRHTLPKESKVFEFCSAGNLQGLRELLSAGAASIFDVDENGWSPLHHACLFARAEVCRFLVENGADPYIMDINMNFPLEILSLFNKARKNTVAAMDIAAVVEMVVQESNFDPLDLPERDLGSRINLGASLSYNPHNTFSISSGLPLRSLQYFLKNHTGDFQSRLRFIWNNFQSIVVTNDEDLQSLELLCKEYEKARIVSGAAPSAPLLHSVVLSWAKGMGCFEHPGPMHQAHIRAILKFTHDLHRRNIYGGTALDLLAENGGVDLVQNWLEMLRRSGINAERYCQEEELLHPGGWVIQAAECCRTLQFTLSADGSAGDIRVLITSRLHPRFESLDSSYLCPSLWRRRRHCLSMQDSCLIRDGKPVLGMPGSFGMEMRPNSEMIWEGSYSGITIRSRYEAASLQKSASTTENGVYCLVLDDKEEFPISERLPEGPTSLSKELDGIGSEAPWERLEYMWFKFYNPACKTMELQDFDEMQNFLKSTELTENLQLTRSQFPDLYSLWCELIGKSNKMIVLIELRQLHEMWVKSLIGFLELEKTLHSLESKEKWIAEEDKLIIRWTRSFYELVVTKIKFINSRRLQENCVFRPVEGIIIFSSEELKRCTGDERRFSGEGIAVDITKVLRPSP